MSKLAKRYEQQRRYGKMPYYLGMVRAAQFLLMHPELKRAHILTNKQTYRNLLQQVRDNLMAERLNDNYNYFTRK